MAGLYIREGIEQDVAPIYELVPRIGRLTQHTPYTYWNLLHNFGNAAFVALNSENEHVGFITSHPTTLPKNEWFIWQVGILPEYRGRGLIDDLQDRVVQVAQESGAVALTTSIEADNPQSFTVFSRLAKRLDTGMYEIDSFTMPSDSPDQEPEVVFRIPLPK